MITILDIGISNLNSVINSLKYLGIEYCIANNKVDIDNSSHLLFPGVGTFGEGMRILQENDLIAPIKKAILYDKKLIFGICLGMQLLFESSEESPNVDGLGLIKGTVIALPKSDKYQIPRIGWADSIVKKEFLGAQENEVKDFYYIHSYCCKPKNVDIITIYDKDEPSIISAIRDNNVYGCQFHPEKSHNAGLELLMEFARSK